MAPSIFSRVTSRLPPWLNRRFMGSMLKFTYHTAVGTAGLMFAQATLVDVKGVSGKSMAPTLSPDFDETGWKDRVLFNRLLATQLVRRGDIVSFWAPHAPEQISVKRIVALPGDTVYTRGRYPFKKVVVPYNHVWVEGDNWRHTVDSNDFGPVPMGLIHGRAEYIVYPPSRFGSLPDPKDFKTYSKVVPAKLPSRLPAELDD